MRPALDAGPPPVGAGDGGSHRASGTGRARLVEVAARICGHTRVRQDACPPAAGAGEGRSRSASGTGRARLVAIATRICAHMHVLQDAGPLPAGAGEGRSPPTRTRSPASGWGKGVCPSLVRCAEPDPTTHCFARSLPHHCMVSVWGEWGKGFHCLESQGHCQGVALPWDAAQSRTLPPTASQGVSCITVW